MASYKDYEILWKKYQDDGVHKGYSIVQYCKDHGIEYRYFERWYKQYYKKRAYQVEITGIPVDSPSKPEVSKTSKAALYSTIASGTQCLKKPKSKESSLRVKQIDFVLSNGLEYHSEDISYTHFRALLDKLDMVCLA